MKIGINFFLQTKCLYIKILSPGQMIRHHSLILLDAALLITLSILDVAHAITQVCLCVCVCIQHVSLTRELGEKLRDGVHVVLEWGCFSLEHPHVAVQPPAPPATNQTTDPTLHCALFVVVRVKKKHLSKNTLCVH